MFKTTTLIAGLLAACAVQAEAPLDIMSFDSAKSLSTAPSHRFATPLSKRIDSDTDGTWTVEGDRALWSYRLQLQGAKSVSFFAPVASLPPETDMFVGGIPHGHPEISRSGMWSKIIAGDLLEIEAWVPVIHRDQFHLVIDEVQAGFRMTPATKSASKSETSAKAAEGDSRNYTCFRNPQNEAEGRATVRLYVANSGQCTGSFVNNSNNDQRPFVLTALHCASNFDNLDIDASSVTIEFNGETACGSFLTHTDGPTMFGASHRAAKDDTWLVEMDSAVPSTIPVFYAGIDARTAAAGSAHPSSASTLLGITHARGLDKQILLFDRVIASSQSRSATPPYYERSPAWDGLYKAGHERASSPGGSGSGLFDLSGHISGTATGYFIAGDCPSGSFDPNDSYGCPVYGQTSVAWGKGLPPEQSLSYWLVPGQANPPLITEPFDALKLPQITMSFLPNETTVGRAATLSWSASSAASCVAEGAWAGNKAISGSESVTPTAEGLLTYTLSCTNAAGTQRQSTTLRVGPASSSGGGGGGGGSLSWLLIAIAGAGAALKRAGRRTD